MPNRYPFFYVTTIKIVLDVIPAKHRRTQKINIHK